jgi:Na+/phosphate symporter
VRQLGTGLAGLGVLFLGMGVMQDAMEPLRGSEAVQAWLSAERGPLPGLLLGAGFTALVQSSSATIGVVVVMSSQGLVPLETGVAMVLGASLGTTVTALLGSIGRPRVALRAAVVHVVINGVGVTLLLLALTPLTELAVWLSPSAPELTGAARLAAETPRQLANAYTIAKLAMAVGFIGLTPQLVAIAQRLVPPRDEERQVTPRYLDDAVLAAPSVALELARKEIERLGRRVASQLRASAPVVLGGSASELAELAAGDDDIDRLHREIVAYLRRMEERRTGEELGGELVQLLNVASYLEIVGDVVQHDLARVGAAPHRGGRAGQRRHAGGGGGLPPHHVRPARRRPAGVRDPGPGAGADRAGREARGQRPARQGRGAPRGPDQRRRAPAGRRLRPWHGDDRAPAPRLHLRQADRPQRVGRGRPSRRGRGSGLISSCWDGPPAPARGRGARPGR